MPQNQTTYRAHGKLLLTGEYLVLDGAHSWATPTKFGQNLQVTPISNAIIHWISYDQQGQIWFEYKFILPLQKPKTDNQSALALYHLLQETQNLNPGFLSEKQGFEVLTHLDFPKNWGLGSSSTLIATLAEWAQIDAFTLLNKTWGGSGYDIACAKVEQAILYQLLNGQARIQTAPFNPNFREQIYFVHLNKKQRSDREIKRYQKLQKDFSKEINTATQLTQLFTKASQLDDFEKLMQEHEQLISSVIQMSPIQKQLFKDYFGQTKSLGAWGGDFIMATGNEDTPAYFTKKGFNTVLKFDKIIL